MMGNHLFWEPYLIFLSIFLVSTTYTCLDAKSLTASCHERERLALLEFKHSVKDDYKVLSSWVGTDCCSWKGVRCDGATGSVVGLNLKGNFRGIFYDDLEEDYYLVGDKVNPYLAELRNLKHLDLSGNYFQGTRIPEFIGSFKQLSYLNLSNAGFSGIIPHHIGNLSNLKVLDLGPSPFQVWPVMVMANDMAWISGLSSLEHLDLGQVELFHAKNIDMVLYMIPSLTYLSLSSCGLYNVDLGLHLNSSKILPNIEHLDLSFNNLEGLFPHFFQNMTSLRFLDLSSNNLSLTWNSLNLLNMIPSLLELHLSGCGLHNALFTPTYSNFSAHYNIQYLDLSDNSIQGRFPSDLMNITSLRVLDLSRNILNSSIPVIPNLLKLDVSNNYIYHVELVGIWRQCHLKELSVSGNYFEEEMIGRSTNMSECSQYALEMLESCNNQLSGPIPKSLGRLTNLRVLRLMSNSLIGSIPKDLVRLRSLEVLDLSSNRLTGQIPTFLGKLTKLELSGNLFTGSIPESLGSLTDLTLLGLGSNNLTGPIPPSLGRLASLQTFSASSNSLNGTIPYSVGYLSKLANLDVSNNSLEGVLLEAHFANLTMLKSLDTTSNHMLIFNISQEWIPPFQLRVIQLGSCKIANGFPQWLQTQRKLQRLVLSNASLYGLLPTWFRKMPLISYLDLSHNKLSGSLVNLPFQNPINGFEVEYQEFLLLQDNHFSGSIPRSVCRRTLVVLDVSLNRLSGSVPNCVGDMQKMSMLILSSNGLSGVLPSSLGNISSSLAWLKLDENNFSGELPRDLENLTFLKVLDLGNNEFSGNIPKWIGESITYLMVLRLHKNKFTGRIPRSLCKCLYLHILDVAHNNLTGSIPPCFGELSAMIDVRKQDTHRGFYELMAKDVIQLMNVNQVMKGMYLSYTKTLNLVLNIDLSSNKLIGEIPPQITTLTLLVGLNLSHNHLSGSIPNNIGNMKALNSLDLSDNQFTGMIPSSMAALNFLSNMNLSHNTLSGRIPTGNQLQTLNDPSIYDGNKDLCGAPLPNNCSNHENLPTTISNFKHKVSNKLPNLWFHLDIMCGFTTGFWGIIGVLLFKKQRRHKFFMIAEVTIGKVFVAPALRVAKLRKGKEAK